jgi:hypothetical protein
LDYEHDHRGQKNQVNEVPDGIHVNESQQREDQKHNKDSPEHMFSFELVYFASHAGVRVRLKIFGWRPRFEKFRTPVFAQPRPYAL